MERILGIGTDLCRIDRLESVASRHGERFLKRIFMDEEREYCSRFSASMPHYAARFSAKEAFSKCLGTGIGKYFSWHDAWVTNDEMGAPSLIISSRAREYITETFAVENHAIHQWVSLAHDTDYAQAMVILSIQS